MQYLKGKNDQLYPVAVDFSVIKKVCSLLNITITEFETIVNNPAHTLVVFHEALKRGSKLEGKEIVNDSIEVSEDVLSQDGIYFQFINAFSKEVLNIFTDPSKKN